MMRPTRMLAALAWGVCAAAFFSRSFPTDVRAQTSIDPCPSTTSSLSLSTATGGSKQGPLAHSDRWRHLDGLWAHRAATASQRIRPLSVDVQLSTDVGQVAVLQDVGDLIMKANPLDLGNVGVRLIPNAAGGFDVSTMTFRFRPSQGTRVALDDDDAEQIALPFAFPFFQKVYDQVFVNSDGNLTFESADTASSERSVSRLLTGPPRVAPFFADLDPSVSGTILTAGDASTFSVTWCSVPQYGGRATVTVQLTLVADGSIEIQISNQTTIRGGVIGVSPGVTTDFTPVDLSSANPVSAARGAIGEAFTTASELDVVGVSRKFLATHPDVFDNIVVFTDTSLIGEDSFAYELSIANTIRGLNLPIFDSSGEYGSAGTLQSLCNMDALSKYPDDPWQMFLEANSTVTVLGQEIGHRWLAFLHFRDYAGRRSQALLGRDAAHWSFFFDSDASVLEGNDIVDLGGGSFRTAAAVERYSLLDQYAMGLVDQSQVPPFFYVENPANITPPRSASSSPHVGVTFTGTRRDVRIGDVIAVLGERYPSAADSPRVYRQAFVYVVSAGTVVDPDAIEKVDRIRVAWDQFFSAATESRMRAETRLTSS